MIDVDLSGFTADNDSFGRPADDALLARLGHELAVPVAGRGSTEVGAGCSFEDALHVAGQRLYANKRSTRGEAATDAKDALLQVLAEQNVDLVTHLRHVSEMAARTARSLGLSPSEIGLTRLAAELHDIGKSAMPASILDKPGPLDAAERAFMQRHSEIGERIVAAAPTLAATAPIVRAAHERPDGLGYPDGLRLDEIPVGSRIIAVVDAFDAMTSDRPYRKAMPPGDALDELRRHAGTQFDPAIVEAFASTMPSRASETSGAKIVPMPMPMPMPKPLVAVARVAA